MPPQQAAFVREASAELSIGKGHQAQPIHVSYVVGETLAGTGGRSNVRSLSASMQIECKK